MDGHRVAISYENVDSLRLELFILFLVLYYYYYNNNNYYYYCYYYYHRRIEMKIMELLEQRLYLEHLPREQEEVTSIDSQVAIIIIYL